ncbi:dipeptidase [Fulvivirga lutimaris]|uniref:dipeptidase n=1 Tax=Fulvivirga lutimaris TaxID=1819566 RepID=UPI0012BD0E92|nr:dipeptidase [Fulvivirga lutimaris]MTI40467.1 membrane dipeptidase [Fulvivirga lutimaris]
MKKISFLLAVIIVACQPKPTEQTVEKELTDEQLMAKADSLAQKFIITDGHVDLPYRLKESGFDIETDSDEILSVEKGDFDFKRAVEGGLNAPFMSIYIPASLQKTGGAKELADTLINMVESIAEKFPDKFAVAKSASEVRTHFEAGIISLPMGMENGAPIGDNIDNVAYFKERGISYITLTHSKCNLICDSSYDSERIHNGLSEFGKSVVEEMNRVGIMVDISHVSDSTFYQVMELSKVPAIASHSSCRHFTPGFERNMSDDMIKLLAEKGGVIQINFGSTFLDAKSREVSTHIRDYVDAYEKDPTDTASYNYVQRYTAENPLFTDVKKVADHIDHVVEIAGIDHVGFGSDYDGVGDSLPIGLKDVSAFPNLIFELLKRGYTDADIEKICSKNVFRVWEEVEKFASQNN